MKNGIGCWCLIILAACIGASNALNVSTFEKIGDAPPAIYSNGSVVYVNGSLYLIQLQSMMEFDIVTKQWGPDRNFKSIERDGYERDYVALVDRIFAILVPHNSTVAFEPLFFFWDKDAGQFQSLRVDVDANAMPSSTSGSAIYRAIGVPDMAGSDAYLAMTSQGSLTSDAVFSKLHVEINGSVPINGEMRVLHRATLPVNIAVEYLVLRENALYWFLRTYTPDKKPVIDIDHVYYYNLISNTTGNISTSSNNGTYFDPSSASYIIGDNHVVTFGRITEMNPWPSKTRQYATWIFDFGSAQWSAFKVRHAGYEGLHGEYVDMVNRVIYQLTSLGVYVAKIDV